MSHLHDNIRKLNTIFAHSKSHATPLLEFYGQLCDIIHANIYLFRPDGSIFARANTSEYRCKHSLNYARISQPDRDAPKDDNIIRHVADFYLETFRKNSSGVYNLYEHNPRCSIENISDCEFMHRYYSLIPIYASSEKEAGILFVKYGESFTEDAICLCEYSALIVSLEMSYRLQTQIRDEAVEQAASGLAVQSLSVGEHRAFAAVLSAFSGDEGDVILSNIAKQSYVSKSLLTGVLKKMESAGVVSTRSMGVKGTRLILINPYLRGDVERVPLTDARRMLEGFTAFH